MIFFSKNCIQYNLDYQFIFYMRKMKNIKIISFSVLITGDHAGLFHATTVVATPTLAPTADISAAATPLPSPTPKIVLFEDSEFTNSCALDSTTDVERFVENGQFHMRVFTPIVRCVDRMYAS